MRRTSLRVLGLLVVTLSCSSAPTPRLEGTEPGDCDDGADNDADGAFDCDDSSCAGAPVCRVAVDAGGTDDAGGIDDVGGAGDAPSADAGPDAGPAGTACVAYAAGLGGPLGAALSAAVQSCLWYGTGCTQCALDGGRGMNCGPGGTLTSCILECIATNEVRPCRPDRTCVGAPDLTCQAGADVCRSTAATTVNDAIGAGELDLECATCFARIPDCVTTEACVIDCTAAGCDCDTCQCDVRCPAAFEACSGLSPYLDCAAVATMCAP